MGIDQMSHKAKLIIFIPGLLAGLFFQLFLGIHCRCAWGGWSCHFIDGALALDVVLLGHIIYVLIKRKFFDDCLWVVGIILTSVFWIPWIYKGITAIYLLTTEGRIGELGH
ncbi:MAG: hypothetical protein WCH99_17830 [Verrucomicrobiota bacterium]